MRVLKFIVEPSWRILLKDLGLNIALLLRKAGLPQDLFTRKNAKINSDQYFRFWNAIEEELDDPLFALHIGQTIRTEKFSPPLFAALCSPDLNTSMRRLSTYKKLIGPIVLNVDIAQDKTTLTIEHLLNEIKMPDSYTEMELVFLVQLVRMATREQITPLAIQSTSPNIRHDKFVEFFGIQPTEGKKNMLVFSADDAERPFLTENEFIWKTFEPELQNRLAEVEGTISFTDRVQQSLFELLPSGVCTIEAVAKNLAVSKRTLQRYLTVENTNFQTVLNATREKLAYHYLANPALTGSQISFLLGYDDANSFVRAFRSWTGKTPQKARQELSDSL
ncbi:MAG: AraC family transcriptional regulator ligand-binding domain-containing protein [Calditrichota bacterium]